MWECGGSRAEETGHGVPCREPGRWSVKGVLGRIGKQTQAGTNEVHLSLRLCARWFFNASGCVGLGYRPADPGSLAELAGRIEPRPRRSGYHYGEAIGCFIISGRQRLECPHFHTYIPPHVHTSILPHP